MELVMLGGINKEEFLASLDAEKQEHQEESVGCKIEIFNPMPREGIVDAVVSEKIAEMKKAETEKIKTEEAEKEKFMNAVTFTDIPSTIKKAGFHPDGSPKMAIAGLFDKEVNFIVRDKKAKYCSDNLNVVLADVKTDWRNLICFIVGLVGIAVSMFIAMRAIHQMVITQNYYSVIILFVVGFFVPFFALPFAAIPTSSKYGSYFTYLKLSDVKVRTKSNFYTEVPVITESILTKIYGPGPFAILFEVTQGWKKVKPDPVIFRVINIGDNQFFEPMVGYDMTPLEKKSLVEKT